MISGQGQGCDGAQGDVWDQDLKWMRSSNNCFADKDVTTLGGILGSRFKEDAIQRQSFCGQGCDGAQGEVWDQDLIQSGFGKSRNKKTNKKILCFI